MYLIDDIFTNILQFTDVHTTYQLCFVDKNLYHKCYKIHHLIPIIHKYKHFYNPYIKSDILDIFLNDISGNDKQYLELIQTTFGKLLYSKQYIYLSGFGNGKSTFMYLMNNFIHSKYGKEFMPGKVTIIKDVYNFPFNKPITEKNSIILMDDISFTDDSPYIKALKKDNPLICICFKTQYVAYVRDTYYKNKKTADRKFIKKIDDNTISAFFNFLLEGCYKN